MENQVNPLGQLFKPKDTGNPSINLLQTSRTNVIVNQELAQILVTLQLAHLALRNDIYENNQQVKSDDWDWLAQFIDDCFTANHNIDGVPRLQFIEGLKADAIIQQEVERRHLMAMKAE